MTQGALLRESRFSQQGALGHCMLQTTFSQQGRAPYPVEMDPRPGSSLSRMGLVFLTRLLARGPGEPQGSTHYPVERSNRLTYQNV